MIQSLSEPAEAYHGADSCFPARKNMSWETDVMYVSSFTRYYLEAFQANRKLR